MKQTLSKDLILGATFCALLQFCALAGAETRVIELVDGSEIRGEVVAMQNGIYTVMSETLGRLTLPADRIRSISDGAAADGRMAPSSGSPASEALSGLQSTIAADAGLMSSIMRLQSDPEVQAVLTDPEVMDAVRRLDFDALRNNPKFRALMDDPAVKQISNGLR